MDPTSVVLPDRIGMYWMANTFQYIHDVLVCIWFVLQFVFKTRNQYWQLLYCQYIRIWAFNTDSIHSNTTSVFSNTGLIYTVSIQIQIRPRSILTNTHQYARILANTSWMDWSVLTLYWDCIEIHTVSIQIHINTSEYIVNELVCIRKNSSYRSVFDCQSGPIQACVLVRIRMCMYCFVLSSLLTYQRHEKTQWSRTKSRHIAEWWVLHMAFPQKNACLKHLFSTYLGVVPI